MESTDQNTRPVSTGFVRLCIALLAATLALIALGGLVRITGSGLGCPDWPLCHGSIIPPFELAPWIEWLHRLAAATVSVLVVAYTVAAWWRYRSHAWLAAPATLAPLLLVAQIWLGQLTVLNEIPPTVAWIHTAVAMAILAVVVVPTAAAYAPLIAAASDVPGTARPARLAAVLGLAALAVYLLLLTGAYVTRSGAAAACPALPACGGLGAPGTPAARLQDIHMLHRIVATGAAVVLALALVEAWRSGVAALRRLAAGVAVILIVQLLLGMANVVFHLPLWSRGLHLAVAGLLWASVVMLTVVVWRGLFGAGVASAAAMPGRAA